MKSPLILAWTLGPTLLAHFAAPAPSAWAGDPVAQVCGNYLNETLAHNTQKQPYCAAAESAEKAANANGVVWKVYAAASAVCTAACVASMTSAGASWHTWACQGSSVAASGLDAIKTQQYMNALQNLAVGGVSYFLFNNKNGRNDGTGATSAGGTAALATTGSGASGSGGGIGFDASKADISSCLTAASTAYSAYTKQQDASNARQSMKANLADVQALGSLSATGAPLTGSTGSQSQGTSAPAASAVSGGASAAGSGGGAPPFVSAASISPVANEACGSAAANPSNAQLAIQCATAMDSGLGSVVSNPQFPSAFQQASGMPLGSYLANSGGAAPNGAVAAGTGGVLNPAGMSKVASAVAVLSPYGPSSSGVYDALGYTSGQGGGGAGSAGDDVATMVGQLLGRILPKKAGPASNSPLVNVKFGASLNRSPADAGAEQDRNLSLFDRVTSRYTFMSSRLLVSTPEQALKSWPQSAPAN